jgi:hypothetical protein
MYSKNYGKFFKTFCPNNRDSATKKADEWATPIQNKKK